MRSGVIVVAAIAGCSDGARVVRVDGGVDATVVHPVGFTCAIQVPRENSPCAVVGTTCEYGESSDPTCNSQVACTAAPGLGLYWHEVVGRACACPAPVVEGGGGCEGDVLCSSGSSVCGCVGGRWVCVRPADGCPPDRPHAGQPCLADQECDYGACVFPHGARMACVDEVWRAEGCQ